MSTWNMGICYNPNIRPTRYGFLHARYTSMKNEVCSVRYKAYGNLEKVLKDNKLPLSLNGYKHKTKGEPYIPTTKSAISRLKNNGNYVYVGWCVKEIK